MGTGKKRLTITLALITSVLLSSVTMLAQQAAAPINSDWARLSSIASGSKLLVKLKSGKSIEGKLTGVSDTSLSLSVKEKPIEVKREDVFTIYQAIKKSATKATLIGLGVGAGAGAVIGVAGSKDDDFAKIDHVATAAFIVIGGAAGALTGYLVGKSGRKQVLIYQARQP
jgi:hypothetical protein